jgi:hypothetical protein
VLGRRFVAAPLPDGNFPFWIVPIMQTAPKKNFMVLGFNTNRLIK